MSDTTTDLATTTGTWVLDKPHTHIAFAAKHAMVSTVRGSFADFDGTLTIDGANPANSKVEVTIQTASISTANEQRDGHLKSPDFLEVEKFPTLTFTSTSVTHTGGDDFTVLGDLTIHGVTKPVELKVDFQGASTDPYGTRKIGFEATTSISRKEFGLVWNAALETGGWLVGDTVKITLDVEANAA